ncbi:MAG: 16S rRNA (guanine(527)-N(7))-methyltransferase RsmG [Clostridiales bacterium]|nr:16S rRNA (guanine(527)-N(7))-methyltransferase RsmG [Clostridiales bacterium]
MDITYLQNLITKHREKFEIYFEELVSYNQKVNLTAITERNEVYTKHFLDSILPIDAIPHGASIVDVGAGAGFPSLPIKIVRPDINLTMVDSLQKRVTFLNYITDKLSIKTQNVHARAEEFAKVGRENFDVAVARAVAKLNTLLEYLLPLVKVGGIVIAYKGSNLAEEFEEAENALNILGGKIVKSIRFDLPNNFGERHILIIEKVRPTDIKYPRPQNKPKTDPII